MTSSRIADAKPGSRHPSKAAEQQLPEQIPEVIRIDDREFIEDEGLGCGNLSPLEKEKQIIEVRIPFLSRFSLMLRDITELYPPLK